MMNNNQIDKVNSDRRSWENVFVALLRPILDRFSKGKARVYIKGSPQGIAGKASDSYEGFARSFIGVAFYLHRKKESIIRLDDGSVIDLAEIYKEGIVNGTNKNHFEYWGKIRSNQRLIENALVSLGLLLTPHHIWGGLTCGERDKVAEWFKSNASRDFLVKNWQWFKVFHYLFLEKFGYRIDEANMKNALDNIEKMYSKNGWYSDGIPVFEYHYDYYVPWSMVFYSLMFCYLADDKYADLKRKYAKRAKLFLKDYQYFFTPGYHPPMYGRSQLYRFASISPWGIAILLDCCDADHRWVKRSMIDTVNTFFEKGMTDREGVLTMGYYKEFKPMLERYSGPGSPYYSFIGFSPLLLPQDHKFWKLPVEGVMPKRIIHPISATKMILLHDGDSHVIMLNAGSSYSKYRGKYNRFAYSNIFLPNYDEVFVDNALLLKSDEVSSWHSRGQIFNSSCKDNVCEIEWAPDNVKKILVKSILIGGFRGYLTAHRICSDFPLAFLSGGFAVSQDDSNLYQTIKEDEIMVRGEIGYSGIRLLHGCAKPLVYQTYDKNPAGRFSLVPCFQGELSGLADVLMFQVWASRSSAPNVLVKRPYVSVDNGTYAITWENKYYHLNLNHNACKAI